MSPLQLPQYVSMEQPLLCALTTCTKSANKKCSKCRQAWYCSRECQTQHWKVHKACCKPNSVTSVPFSVIPADDYDTLDRSLAVGQSIPVKISTTGETTTYMKRVDGSIYEHPSGIWIARSSSTLKSINLFTHFTCKKVSPPQN